MKFTGFNYDLAHSLLCFFFSERKTKTKMNIFKNIRCDCKAPKMAFNFFNGRSICAIICHFDPSECYTEHLNFLMYKMFGVFFSLWKRSLDKYDIKINGVNIIGCMSSCEIDAVYVSCWACMWTGANNKPEINCCCSYIFHCSIMYGIRRTVHTKAVEKIESNNFSLVARQR